LAGIRRFQADKSTQWGIGGVWEPSPGISLSVDYFDILLKNAIYPLTAVQVFEHCSDGITGSNMSIHPSRPRSISQALPGPIVLEDAFLTNLATVRTSGHRF
jgi:hypothetical protein